MEAFKHRYSLLPAITTTICLTQITVSTKPSYQPYSHARTANQVPSQQDVRWVRKDIKKKPRNQTSAVGLLSGAGHDHMHN